MVDAHLIIGLNAVLAAMDDASPRVLCVERSGHWGLPFGQFDPNRHRTFELGLRDFVERQAGVPLGYVEQLYTFGDMGRESPRARMQEGPESGRVVSVGYLALAPDMPEITLDRAAWHDWYRYFPWEDWRGGAAAHLEDTLLPALRAWAATPERLGRLQASFGLDGVPWEEERALERYELMYEAGLVEEAARDGRRNATPLKGTGDPMISDHRRILATAISRLRGKLRYRPIIFKMLPSLFTLTDAQIAAEAILGFEVHKQNFRRSLENARLVEKTGDQVAQTGGRPAALYRASAHAGERYAPGLALPRLRA